MKAVDFVFISFVVALKPRSNVVSDKEVLESAIALNVNVIFNLIAAVFKYRILEIEYEYSVWLTGCLIAVSGIYMSFRFRYLNNRMLPDRFHGLQNILEKRRTLLTLLVILLIFISYLLILWPV